MMGLNLLLLPLILHISQWINQIFIDSIDLFIRNWILIAYFLWIIRHVAYLQ